MSKASQKKADQAAADRAEASAKAKAAAAIKATPTADDEAKLEKVVDNTYVEEDKFKPENVESTGKNSVKAASDSQKTAVDHRFDTCMAASILMALDKPGNGKIKIAVGLANDQYKSFGRSIKASLYVSWYKKYAAMEWDKDNKVFKATKSSTVLDNLKKEYQNKRGEFFKVRLENPPTKEPKEGSGNTRDTRFKPLKGVKTLIGKLKKLNATSALEGLDLEFYKILQDYELKYDALANAPANDDNAESDSSADPSANAPEEGQQLKEVA